MDFDNLYQEYSRALAGRPLPLAWIDLDRLEANARDLLRRAAGVPLRLATKSVRCTAILSHVLGAFGGLGGLMTFSAREAALLATEGFDDLLVAYPTLEVADLEPCWPAVRAGKRVTFMADAPEHLRLLDRLAAAAGVRARVCLDLDLSTDFPGLHFGVWRSPLRSAEDVLALARTCGDLAHVDLVGLMGYEGQLAGVTDAVPGRPLYSALVRLLKRLSTPAVLERRQRATAELRGAGFGLEFVNGGGTGSLEVTRTDPSVTELTVGSGLYSPTLFDQYHTFRHLPAAGFALPVVRQAASDIWACSGGGYIASGGIGRDKEPQPYLPSGISLFPSLGAGEVQTSVRSPKPLALGQPVFFRHAKAGELFERFDEVHLLRAGGVEAVVPTYRGQRWTFF